MPSESGSPHRVAVITGATGGIGAGVSKALAKAGWRLVLTARSEQKLNRLIGQLPGDAIAIPGDLRERSFPENQLAAAIGRFGRCEMCFNNAGFLEVGPVETVDVDRICEMDDPPKDHEVSQLWRLS